MVDYVLRRTPSPTASARPAAATLAPAAQPVAPAAVDPEAGASVRAASGEGAMFIDLREEGRKRPAALQTTLGV